MREWDVMRLLKGLLFAALTIGIAAVSLKILNYKDMGGGGGWTRFYAEQADIDALFFGNSHAHCTVDHGYLWDHYGIAGYTMSAGAQNFAGTYYFVKEALRVQKPQVIAVEVYGATGGDIGNSEYDVYKNNLGMAWSLPSFAYTGYLADDMRMDSSWRWQVFLKLPIVHSRYAELGRSDFQDDMPFMRGYRGSFDVTVMETPAWEDDQTIAALNEEKEKYLQDILDMAREKGVKVLLFAAPYDLTQEEQEQYNRIAELADENGVPFLNFNHMYQEIGHDYQTDMRETSHVNNYGADKVTEYLARFLKDQYALPDRRGQEGYEAWEQNSLYLRNKKIRHDLQSAQDINEYLQRVKDMTEEELVVIALTGNYNALGEVYLEKLTSLGITAQEYYQGGAWIFRGGDRIAYFPGKEYDSCIKTLKGEIHIGSREFVSEQGELKDEVQIVADGRDCRMVENGVNILVYNEELWMLTDAAGDDVYLGLGMTHAEIAEE